MPGLETLWIPGKGEKSSIWLFYRVKLNKINFPLIVIQYVLLALRSLRPALREIVILLGFLEYIIFKHGSEPVLIQRILEMESFKIDVCRYFVLHRGRLYYPSYIIFIKWFYYYKTIVEKLMYTLLYDPTNQNSPQSC